MIAEKILTEAQYESMMEEILDLMNKGEKNLSAEEETKLRSLAMAANAFESEHYRETAVKI